MVFHWAVVEADASEAATLTRKWARARAQVCQWQPPHQRVLDPCPEEKTCTSKEHKDPNLRDTNATENSPQLNCGHCGRAPLQCGMTSPWQFLQGQQHPTESQAPLNLYIHTHVHVHIHMHIHVHKRYILMYAYTCIYIYICYTHIYIYTYICIYMLIYTRRLHYMPFHCIALHCITLHQICM